MFGRGDRWLAALVAVLMVVAGLAYVGPRWGVAGLHFGRSAGAPTDVSSPTSVLPAPSQPAPTTSTATLPTEPTATFGATPTATSSPTVTSLPTPVISTSATTMPATTTPRSATAQAGWVAAENAKPGTDAWRITARDPLGWIEGYTAKTSVHPGDRLTMYVDTPAPSWTVAAYRMGFYGGKQGRLVWTSPTVIGARQPVATLDQVTGLAEARWNASLTLAVGDDWAPGSYLLKLTSSANGSSYIPLTVRDDRAHADLLAINAITTWQAYNAWGGCSLYSCKGVKGRARAVKVSFDRPYARPFGDGSADFLDHELPVIALTEELGLDTAYATDLDLHEQPSLASLYHGVLSMGHDEYYSGRMRRALVEARDRGVNLAFFGANAVYRHVRFEASTDGRANRVMVNYRTNDDPIRATDATEVTAQWRSQGKPEAELVGVQYICADVHDDMVVASSKHWIWAGAGVHDGQVLKALVGNEADGRFRATSPANLDLLAASPVMCNKTHSLAHMAYYSAPSGAGVFATGTIWWVCALEAKFCSVPQNVPVVRAATANVLKAFAQESAGAHHPSGVTART